MKIDSSLFKDPMKFNRIIIEKDKIKIHNFDASSMGVMSVRSLKSNNTDHYYDFVLNEKDYKFISKLGMIDLKATDNCVTVNSNGNKYKFSKLVEFPDFVVNIDNMKELDVSLYEVIMKASSFTSGSKESAAHPQYTGINILNDCIIASNRAAVFRKEFTNDTGYEINIPVESVKHIEDHEKLKLRTNGKFLLCSTPGRNFYTTLIETRIINRNPELKTVYSFRIEKSGLLNELKLIKEYADIVKLKCTDKNLNLIASTNEQEFDVNVPVTDYEGDPIILNFDVKNLILILNALDIEEVKFEISDIALRIFDESLENEFILPRYGQIEEE